jgi:alpha-soluble NSF attachment protein
LVDAYKAYRQSDPADAARVLEEAVMIFMQRGQFRRAANFKMDLGELYEKDLDDPVKALGAFEDAGQMFYDDSAEALSSKAFLRVGDLAALNKDYHKATEMYERVAKQSVNNNLSRWSVKETLFKSGLCHLCEDPISTQRSLEEYAALDQSFTETKEFALLNDLLEAVKEGDDQAFADKLAAFNQFSPLDNWKVTICLRIRESIQAAEDDIL